MFKIMTSLQPEQLTETQAEDIYREFVAWNISLKDKNKQWRTKANNLGIIF